MRKFINESYFHSKMGLIKYYNLESLSWKDVSDLERNLQKHLLDKKHISGILETDVEDIAKAKSGNGDKVSLASLLYDSGDFDVLYKRSWTISKGKKRLFGKNIPLKIGTELVVRAIPQEILELQDYLSDSGFEVIEARGVATAVYKFNTVPRTLSTAKGGKQIYESQFSSESFDLKVDIKLNDGLLGGVEGTALQGCLSGQVEKILKARKIIRSEGSDLPIYSEGIVFY